MLKWLGRIGKGYGTAVGIGVAVLGAFGQTDAARAVGIGGDALWQVAQNVGLLLAAFGVGRKAGAALK